MSSPSSATSYYMTLSMIMSLCLSLFVFKMGIIILPVERLVKSRGVDTCKRLKSAWPRKVPLSCWLSDQTHQQESFPPSLWPFASGPMSGISLFGLERQKGRSSSTRGPFCRSVPVWHESMPILNICAKNTWITT